MKGLDRASDSEFSHVFRVATWGACNCRSVGLFAGKKKAVLKQLKLLMQKMTEKPNSFKLLVLKKVLSPN